MSAPEKRMCPAGIKSSKEAHCDFQTDICGQNAFVHRELEKAADTLTSSRVAQLEEKLDDLVSLLKSSHDVEVQDQTADETVDTSPLRNPSTGTSAKTCSPEAAMNGNTVNRKRCTLPFRDDDESTSSQPTSKPTGQEDVYLQVYRSHMSRYFPFVMILDSISAEELAQSKPFLLEVIQVAASYKEQGRQALRGKEVLEDLIRRLLFDSEKSMDLLQGLLVYICWYGVIAYVVESVHTHNHQVQNYLLYRQAIDKSVPNGHRVDGRSRPQSPLDGL
jgi:hypothetical protein